jgi:hypothetical protein
VIVAINPNSIWLIWLHRDIYIIIVGPVSQFNERWLSINIANACRPNTLNIAVGYCGEITFYLNVIVTVLSLFVIFVDFLCFFSEVFRIFFSEQSRDREGAARECKIPPEFRHDKNVGHQACPISFNF